MGTPGGERKRVWTEAVPPALPVQVEMTLCPGVLWNYNPYRYDFCCCGVYLRSHPQLWSSRPSFCRAPTPLSAPQQIPQPCPPSVHKASPHPPPISGPPELDRSPPQRLRLRMRSLRLHFVRWKTISSVRLRISPPLAMRSGAGGRSAHRVGRREHAGPPHSNTAQMRRLDAKTPRATRSRPRRPLDPRRRAGSAKYPKPGYPKRRAGPSTLLSGARTRALLACVPPERHPGWPHFVLSPSLPSSPRALAAGGGQIERPRNHESAGREGDRWPGAAATRQHLQANAGHGRKSQNRRLSRDTVCLHRSRNPNVSLRCAHSVIGHSGENGAPDRGLDVRAAAGPIR